MYRKLVRFALFTGLFSAAVSLQAAPRMDLRLPNALGSDACREQNTCPIWIEQGAAGPADFVLQAANLGDGTLAVSATSPAPWLSATIGAPAQCGDVTCTPVNLVFAASALAPGEYNTELRVEAPGAEDAPRFVPIRIYVGGDIPERFDFYVPPTPGAADFVDFQTPAGPTPEFGTAGGFLSISSNGLGSMRFLHTHRLVASGDGLPAGENMGSIFVSGSSFAPDNRIVPVSLTVTSNPIAVLSAERLSFKGVTGRIPQDQFLIVNNRGQGNLTISNVTLSTVDGGGWLTLISQDGGALRIRASAEGVEPGLYSGTILVEANAVNAPIQVPVSFQVDAELPPAATFNGTVNGATFDSSLPIAPGTLISIFGDQLSTGFAGATTLPLPTEMAGTSVTIDGIPAPLTFVSAGQINAQVPNEVGGGRRMVQVTRDGMAGNMVGVDVGGRSAGLFRFGIGEYGAIVNNTQGGNFPLPREFSRPGFDTAPARPGDVISIFATGLGQTSPVVPTGEAAPASPLANGVDVPIVSFSRRAFGPSNPPIFVGLAPGFVGLFQINVVVPEDAPADPRTGVTLDFTSGGRRSNTVEIAVELP